jgi:hypothetical protein
VYESVLLVHDDVDEGIDIGDVDFAVGMLGFVYDK